MVASSEDGEGDGDEGDGKLSVKIERKSFTLVLGKAGDGVIIREQGRNGSSQAFLAWEHLSWLGKDLMNRGKALVGLAYSSFSLKKWRVVVEEHNNRGGVFLRIWFCSSNLKLLCVPSGQERKGWYDLGKLIMDIATRRDGSVKTMVDNSVVVGRSSSLNKRWVDAEHGTPSAADKMDSNGDWKSGDMLTFLWECLDLTPESLDGGMLKQNEKLIWKPVYCKDFQIGVLVVKDISCIVLADFPPLSGNFSTNGSKQGLEQSVVGVDGNSAGYGGEDGDNGGVYGGLNDDEGHNGSSQSFGVLDGNGDGPEIHNLNLEVDGMSVITESGVIEGQSLDKCWMSGEGSGGFEIQNGEVGDNGSGCKGQGAHWEEQLEVGSSSDDMGMNNCVFFYENTEELAINNVAGIHADSQPLVEVTMGDAFSLRRTAGNDTRDRCKDLEVSTTIFEDSIGSGVDSGHTVGDIQSGEHNMTVVPEVSGLRGINGKEGRDSCETFRLSSIFRDGTNSGVVKNRESWGVNNNSCSTTPHLEDIGWVGGRGPCDGTIFAPNTITKWEAMPSGSKPIKVLTSARNKFGIKWVQPKYLSFLNALGNQCSKKGWARPKPGFCDYLKSIRLIETQMKTKRILRDSKKACGDPVDNHRLPIEEVTLVNARLLTGNKKLSCSLSPEDFCASGVKGLSRPIDGKGGCWFCFPPFLPEVGFAPFTRDFDPITDGNRTIRVGLASMMELVDESLSGKRKGKGGFDIPTEGLLWMSKAIEEALEDRSSKSGVIRKWQNEDRWLACLDVTGAKGRFLSVLVGKGKLHQRYKVDRGMDGCTWDYLRRFLILKCAQRDGIAAGCSVSGA